MISDYRLTAMLGVSLLLHAAAASLLGRNAWSAPVPGGFDNLEIRLVGATPPWTAPAARLSPVTKPSTPSGTNPASARGSQPDSVVEARHDVASLNNPKPAYPLGARRRGIEGRVLIAAQVTADGRCAEARVRQSSGHELLDASARDAVRHWRFVPARRGDTPVDSWVEVPIVFRLGS